MTLYPFLTAETKDFRQVIKLSRWAKKYKKFGAYIEVKETELICKSMLYEVKLFCPKLHTDFMGNTAIKKFFN